MANKKISELTAHTDVSTLAAADYIPIVVGGVTKRISIGILLDGLLRAAALQTAQPLSVSGAGDVTVGAQLIIPTMGATPGLFGRLYTTVGNAVVWDQD